MPVPLDEPFDCIVHSGDMMPNTPNGIRLLEESYQTRWVEENAPKFHPRYRGVPVFITPGNHDFIDPTPIMREAGIDARYLCEEVLTYRGVRFYGHPWTPERSGRWNWKAHSEEEMAWKLRGAESLMDGIDPDEGIDVFVSHGPMRGVLDWTRSHVEAGTYEIEHVGCPVLLKTMQAAFVRPKALLHGHIHDAAGVTQWHQWPTATTRAPMLVSNASLTQRVVEVP